MLQENIKKIENLALRDDYNVICGNNMKSLDNQDNEEVFSWLEKAIEIILHSDDSVHQKTQADFSCQEKEYLKEYITCLLHGKGCEVNVEKAIEVINIAAKRGMFWREYDDPIGNNINIDVWDTIYFDDYIQTELVTLQTELDEVDGKSFFGFKDSEYDIKKQKKEVLNEKIEELKRKKVLNASDRITDFLELRMDICFKERAYKSILEFAFKYIAVDSKTYEKLVEKYGLSKGEMKEFFGEAQPSTVPFHHCSKRITFVALSDSDIAPMALYSGMYDIAIEYFGKLLDKSNIGYTSFDNKCDVSTFCKERIVDSSDSSYVYWVYGDEVTTIYRLFLLANLLWLSQYRDYEFFKQRNCVENYDHYRGIHLEPMKVISYYLLPICYYYAYNYKNYISDAYNGSAESTVCDIFFYTDCLFKLFEEYLSRDEYEAFVKVFKLFEDRYHEEYKFCLEADKNSEIETYRWEYRQAHPEEFIDDEGFHPGESPEEFWSHED